MRVRVFDDPVSYSVTYEKTDDAEANMNRACAKGCFVGAEATLGGFALAMAGIGISQAEAHPRLAFAAYALSAAAAASAVGLAAAVATADKYLNSLENKQA